MSESKLEENEVKETKKRGRPKKEEGTNNEKLKKENYINKIYEEMDNKEIFKPFIDEINEYIEMRVNENDR